MSVFSALPDYETAEVVQVLHERDGRRLAKFECDGGATIMYGVERDGDIEFLGTKAEAKKVYGSRRKGT